MGERGSRRKENRSDEPRLRLLVSSVVYGYEELLESLHALLDGFGYEVLMSHKGTVPIDPNLSAMDSCLRAVDDCDLFLGIILPRYGSGREAPEGLSITHREALRAIEINKPRWFLVHEYVAIARQLLDPLRNKRRKNHFALVPGVQYKQTPVLSDLRVLDLYEAALLNHVPDVADRRGNWVQTFGPDEDARLFAVAQFRRYRELADKHLMRLRDVPGIRARVARRRP